MLGNPDIAYFATTNGRSPHRIFGIKQADRLFHTYAIGKTGTGKTTLLETIALQDMVRGCGVTVIDPHGDLAERLVAQIPPWRERDLIYLNAPDPTQLFGYNPLRRGPTDKIPLAAAGRNTILAINRNPSLRFKTRSAHFSPTPASTGSLPIRRLIFISDKSWTTARFSS